MARGTATEIAYWLGCQRTLPSVWELMQMWELSRATAFRWRAFVRAGGRAQAATGASRRWPVRRGAPCR